MDQNTLILIAIGIGIIAVVFIVFLLRKKIKTVIFKAGKIFDFSIETHQQQEKSNQERLSKITEETSSEAYLALKWIQEEVSIIDGSYIVSTTTLKNKEIATLMYTRCTKRIIGTAFFEDPAQYHDDLAQFVKPDIDFIRITTQEVCPDESQIVVSERLKCFQSNSRLVVVPDDAEISKIGGLFCEMSDGSYLAFIALNNKGNTGENNGVTFCGNTAEELFRYYNSWASCL